MRYLVLILMFTTSSFGEPVFADWLLGGGVSNTPGLDRIADLYNRNSAPDAARVSDFGGVFFQIYQRIAPYADVGVGIGPVVSLELIMSRTGGGIVAFSTPSAKDIVGWSNDYLDVPLYADVRFGLKSRLAPFLKAGYAQHWVKSDLLKRVENKPYWGAGIAYRTHLLEFSLDLTSEPTAFLFEDASAQREEKIIPNNNVLRVLFLLNIDKSKPMSTKLFDPR